MSTAHTVDPRLCPAMFADPTLPLAVVVGNTRWDEPPRMRHHVTRQLMRRLNVLFVEFFATEGNGNQVRVVDERLLVFSPQAGPAPPVRWYANNPFVHARVNKRFASRIADVASDLPGDPKVLVNFCYDFPEIMGAALFNHRSYVCNDEFPKMQLRASKPNWLKWSYQWRLFQWYENRVARAADRCFASHTPLETKLRRVNGNTTLLLHGHESSGSAPVRSHAKAANTCVRAAYMGYITYNLLVGWIEAALRAPELDFYLIGPICKFDRAVFRRHPNLHHVGPLDGAELHAMLGSMDVLTMPYDPSIPEVQVQTVSNKFFQYVAAGRPVVISDMPYYIEMPPGVIYKARTAEEFVETIRRAHAEDCDEFRRLRAQIAAENTWDKRGDQLFEAIRQDMGGRFPCETQHR
jgi:glycosyltransferase involved in cell wall biosynthesis